MPRIRSFRAKSRKGDAPMLLDQGAERTGRGWRMARNPLYSLVPGSPGYGDKVRRVIDAADPGAVPGGSTKSPAQAGF
jgi:hypothetical protein